MKPYPIYKNSKVEWIGEIPEGWEVMKLKYIGKSLIGITYSPTDVVNSEAEGVLVLRSSNIQNGCLSFSDCVYVKKEINEKYLTKEGDILLCARNGSAHLIGKSAYIDKNDDIWTFGAFMSIVRSKLKKYLFYYLNSQVFESQKGLYTTSTINQLTASTLNSMFVAFPRFLPEQTAIANFLNYETGKIDNIIAARQRQIELLKELKSSVISHVVTKGINPKAKMKDSGVEWIGEIPEHWEVGKMRYSIKILTDFTANGSFGDLAKNVTYKNEPDYSRLIRLTDLRENLNNENAVWLNKASHEYLSKSELFGGELLIANVGAYAGFSCIMPCVDRKATLGPNMFLIKYKSSINTPFANYLLSSKQYWEYLQVVAQSSAQPKLNKENIKNTPFLIPCISEQQQIVTHIEQRTAKIENAIAKYQQQITLLKEYRASLITEAVTGKIDVRDFKNTTKNQEA